MGLPITTVIRVSLSKIPNGLSEVAVNNLCIFTNDTTNFNGDIYRIYTSSTSVGADLGANSLTTLMAENIFAQTPNILTGNGSLIIIPLLNSVSATAGTFTTANISGNLANFLTVTDGTLKITLNSGTAKTYTGLNFTNCTTMQNVVDVLQENIRDIIFTLQGSTSQEIKMTSKKFGITSTFLFAASGSGTDLMGTNYLNTATGVIVAGAASSGETIKEAIIRTQGKVFYEGILDTLNLEDTKRELDASYCQSIDKMYFIASATTEDIAGLATTISGANQDKTRALLYSEGIQDSKLMIAAYASRLLSINFDASNTVHTMHLKQLINVEPDSLFNTTSNETIATECDTAGMDFYTAFSSVNGCFSTGGNDFADNVICDVWLKFALEVAGFNYLYQTNTKVPQTEAGMDGLKGAYEQVCIQGVTNGAFAPGTWNSSQTFGDPATFKRQIAQNGYYIYSAPIGTQSQANRNARIAPTIQIAVKRAGAIHESIVNVIVEN